MKFKINRDHFANGLAQVLNVVGSKATMPILSNVLIEAEKDHISLTTTNLDLGIRCRKGKRSSRQLRTREVEWRLREKEDQRERQEVAAKPADLTVEG